MFTGYFRIAEKAFILEVNNLKNIKVLSGKTIQLYNNTTGKFAFGFRGVFYLRKL